MNIRQHIALFLLIFVSLSLWAAVTIYDQVFVKQTKSNDFIIESIPLSTSITQFQKELERYISPTYPLSSINKNEKGLVKISTDMNQLIKKLREYDIDDHKTFSELRLLTRELSTLKKKIKEVQLNKNIQKNKIIKIYKSNQRIINSRLKKNDLLKDKNILKKFGNKIDSTFLYKYFKNITQNFKYSTIDDIKLTTYQSLIMMSESNHQILNILESSQLNNSFIKNSKNLKTIQETFLNAYKVYPKKDLLVLREHFLESGRKIYNYFDKTSKQKKIMSTFSTKITILKNLLKNDVTKLINIKLNQIKNVAKKSTQDAFRTVFFIFILYILLILLFVLSIEKRIINPLSKITSFTKNFSLHKINLTTQDFPKNETGLLFNSFLKMLSKLNLQFDEIKEQSSRNLALQTKINQASKMATIGNLASGVSHEIKNPLAIIQLSLDDLTSGLQQEQINPKIFTEEINNITDASSRINKIVSGLSMQSYQSVEGQIQEIDLGALIKSTCSFLKPLFLKENIKIRHISPAKKLLVKTTPDKVSQSLINIISNAKDAKINDQDLTIEVCVTSVDKFYVIKISDNGIGISKENINKIFDPFYTTKNFGDGLGLGLSLTYNMIKDCGCTIKCVSNPNSGTQFIISLPMTH